MSEAQLDAMVQAATVDCYSEDEQVGGLFIMIEDNLAVPFKTLVLGVGVTVERVELTGAARSWPSVAATRCCRPSRSWICPCRRRRRWVGSGSRRTATGWAERRG
jgi:hypothetical protein